MGRGPITFKSSAAAAGDFDKPWLIRSGGEQALCAIPAEFSGSAGGFSPEDLYLQSLMNCFLGTFKVFAKTSRISFTGLNVEGDLVVDQDETKKTIMKSCHLNIEIQGADRPDRLETVVAKVFKDGFILNSVKTQITYGLTIDGKNCEKLV